MELLGIYVALEDIIAIASIAKAYLSEPLRERVASGAIDVFAALLRQARINESIAVGSRRGGLWQDRDDG